MMDITDITTTTTTTIIITITTIIIVPVSEHGQASSHLTAWLDLELTG
jgi:hypothetical protein